MKKIVVLFFTLFVGLILSFQSFAVDKNLPPDQLVLQVSNDVLDSIRKDPELAKANPAHINKLVDESILPFTDFQTMTRMAVGPAWRKASEGERQEIMTLFRKLLVAVYSGAVKEASDYHVALRNNKYSDKDNTVIIRTNLLSKSHDPISLDYRLLKKDGAWKIFDVNIGGVWLVENYRSQFSSVIGNSGIKGLIEQLKDRVSKL